MERGKKGGYNVRIWEFWCVLKELGQRRTFLWSFSCCLFIERKSPTEGLGPWRIRFLEETAKSFNKEAGSLGKAWKELSRSGCWFFLIFLFLESHFHSQILDRKLFSWVLTLWVRCNRSFLGPAKINCYKNMVEMYVYLRDEWPG